MKRSTVRLVSVIGTGSILCEAGEEILCITCLKVGENDDCYTTRMRSLSHSVLISHYN